MSSKLMFISVLLAFSMLLSAFAFVGCDGDSIGGVTDESASSDNEESLDGSESNGGSESGKKETTSKEKEEVVKKTEVLPTVYDAQVIKTAAQTAAGSFDAWKGQVKKAGENNDDPTTDAVIKSPFHTLTINGKTVPVYTARSGLGAHSFAWVDVSGPTEFALDVTLTLSENFGKCIVLPESRKVNVQKNGKQIKTILEAEGSYTYTFAKSSDAEITDPAFAPVTLMVTRKNTVKIPRTYKTQYIEPGYHADEALEFTQQNTAYVMKKGFHQISSIGLPSNSMLIIEQGAYIQVSDRQVGGVYNTTTAIHADRCENVKIISRGLLDCGLLQGGNNKYKHVVNVGSSKDVSIEGLTIVNSNTWTVCVYNSSGVSVNKNMLLSYRTYTDGIMMSDSTDCSGRYNFVRTGDDGIEFKATGWWDAPKSGGKNCIYEYNDVWTDKGVGYGVIYEAGSNMDSMIFRNNSVGFAQPKWTERNAAIDCHLGNNGTAKWSNITFENFEIYHVISPSALSVRIVEEGGTLENITFKNINIKSVANGTYALRMHYDAKAGGISGIKLENVTFCGKKLTSADKSNTTLFSNKATAYWGNLTIS